jgi:hypothetical protein
MLNLVPSVRLRQWGVAALLICMSAASATAQGFFPRGDSDCSAIVTAADIVGTLRASSGASVCDNDDCDRDGRITGADATCAARCLFGTCPVIPHGPFITQVVAESTPDIRPLALIRIQGTGFGPADSLKQVTIGGFGAEVVDASRPDTLHVIVPLRVVPGPADIVVIDGDVPGAPFTVIIAEPTLLGQFDTYDSTLELLDAAIAKAMALDLESTFGDQTATLREALDTARNELAAQRAAVDAAGLTPEQRAELDIAMDISGFPEHVRQLIAQLDDALEPRKHYPRADTLIIASAISAVAQTLGIGTGILAGLSPLAIGAIVISTIATVIGVILGTLNAPVLVPIILSVAFTNADGQRTRLPTHGGLVTVRAANIVGPGVLGVRRPGGLQNIATRQLGGGMFDALLPQDNKFCGRFELVISDGRLKYSSPVPQKLQPELLGVLPSNDAPIGSELRLPSRGVEGCVGQSYAVYETELSRRRTYENLYSKAPVRTTTPDLEPGSYELRLDVDATLSDPRDVRILGLKSIRAACTPNALFVPPETPVDASCSLGLDPPTIKLPRDVHVTWQSSDAQIGMVNPDMPKFPFATKLTVAELPGNAEVTAMLTCTGATHVCDEDEERRSYMSDPAIVTVSDKTPPTVTVTTVPPPGTEIQPGGTIMVTVKATDNVAPASINLTAGGEPVGNGNQEFDCSVPTHECETTFTVQVKRSGYTNRDIDIAATVSDYSSNEVTSDPVSFTAASAAPVITGVTNPVNAGAALTITGTGFGTMQGDSAVAIGGAGAAVTAWGETSITATVPSTLSGPDIPVVVTVGGVASNTVTTTVLGTGDVQVTLIWHDTNDIDLHVTDPAGAEIFYASRSSASGGKLDVDANAGCTTTTSEPRENIFWPTGGAPTGKYMVKVVYFDNCTEPATSSGFEVTLLLDGKTSQLLSGSVGPGGAMTADFTR